ncbi:MAG TPA: type VI secretion system contractile sheath small subunit [bacterium]|nr:type VI secretion system contractile sheath small subunit [bacterium]
MVGESIHKKKERVRPPRVHISYEVELNGAQVMKELPFVVGVMADLSGNPKDPPAKLKDRSFKDIDRDNFDEILKGMKPRLAYKVNNTLQDDGSELSVELNFEKMGDFRPDAVAKQVEPLKNLIEVRDQLKDLLGRTEGNDRLEDMLKAIIEKEDVRAKLKDTLGAEPPASGGGGDAGGEEG